MDWCTGKLKTQLLHVCHVQDVMVAWKTNSWHWPKQILKLTASQTLSTPKGFSLNLDQPLCSQFNSNFITETRHRDLECTGSLTLLALKLLNSHLLWPFTTYKSTSLGPGPWTLFVCEPPFMGKCHYHHPSSKKPLFRPMETITEN